MTLEIRPPKGGITYLILPAILSCPFRSLIINFDVVKGESEHENQTEHTHIGSISAGS